MTKRVWSTLLIVVALTGCAGGGDRVTVPTASVPLQSSTSAPSSTITTSAPATETIATGLPLPWGLAFLPDGTALVTLRDKAEVLHITEGAAPVSVGRIPGVVPTGEGGLLGIAVSPAFASDRTVFATSPRPTTTGSSG
jgi:glucose/arabinose dehydrogenase